MDSPESDLQSTTTDLSTSPRITPFPPGPPARRVFLSAHDDNDLILRLGRMFGLPGLPEPHAGPYGRAAQLALWLFGEGLEGRMEEFYNVYNLMNPFLFFATKARLGYPDRQETDELKVVQWYLESVFPADASDGPSAQIVAPQPRTPPPSILAKRTFGAVENLTPIPLRFPRRSDSPPTDKPGDPKRAKKSSDGGPRASVHDLHSTKSPPPCVLEKEITQRQPDDFAELEMPPPGLREDGDGDVGSGDEDMRRGSES